MPDRTQTIYTMLYQLQKKQAAEEALELVLSDLYSAASAMRMCDYPHDSIDQATEIVRQHLRALHSLNRQAKKELYQYADGLGNLAWWDGYSEWDRDSDTR